MTGKQTGSCPVQERMVIHMAADIAALLDKAKVMHSLSSDYKLALVLGVSFSTPGNYRAGKTLPDARVISLLCDLTGDDPEILAAQIEEERAKTPEAKHLWHSIAERLAMTARQGVAAGVFSVSVLAALGAVSPMDAHASDADLRKYTLWKVKNENPEITGDKPCSWALSAQDLYIPWSDTLFRKVQGVQPRFVFESCIGTGLQQQCH